MKKTVLNRIGIDIDESYKWKDTLFLDEHVCSECEEDFKKCKRVIRVKFSKKIDYSGARQIEKDIFACEKFIYDKNKNAKITFEDENTCVIESNQEANEWLVIMLQIMLLKEGFSFIHAAAVSNKKGEGVVMPSWGGVGKTATVSKMVDNGYKLLGDDLNILSEDGKIIGFPKKFVLYFYHKNLFPEVFKEKKVKCGPRLNSFYSSIIPSTKRVLRKIPGVLAYARKHNPQSMKVSPYDIFSSDKIGKEAVIKEALWLERAVDKEYVEDRTIDAIVSKSVSVTMNEIFTENINAILIMCGMGIVDYDEIFGRMYRIYSSAFGNSSVKAICIDKAKPVECVADKVLETVSI